LRQRNYAFHAMRGVGLALTRADLDPANRFKETGRARRIHMIAVSAQDLHQILRYSQNAVEAADQVEAIATGAQLKPSFTHGAQPAPAIDGAMIEKLVTSRVQNEIAKLVDQSQQEQSKQTAEIEELKRQLAESQKPADAPQKPARKSRKNSVVSKAKALADAGSKGSGKLTSEQEQQLEQTMSRQQSNESAE